MKKKIIFFWVCNYSNNNGEGILARQFVDDLKITFKSYKIIPIKINKQSNTFYAKYILPFTGIINLWIKYFQNYKTCYINYLPLWNFLIFLLLPPKTIIGPITGTISKDNYFFFKNFFEKISSIIIKSRYTYLLFSNNFYHKKFNNCYLNYIIKKIQFQKKKFKKKYDFIFYYRKNYDQNHFINNLIIKLSNNNYKIIIIGDKLYSKNTYNYGYINNKKVNNLIKKTRFAVGNKENLYSFFIQKCISNNLIVFYNYEFKSYEKFKLKNFYPIPFDNLKIAYNIIKKKILKPVKKNTDIQLNFNNFFLKLK